MIPIAVICVLLAGNLGALAMAASYRSSADQWRRLAEMRQPVDTPPAVDERLKFRAQASDLCPGLTVFVWAHNHRSHFAGSAGPEHLWKYGKVIDVLVDPDLTWLPVAVTFDTGATVYAQSYAAAYVVNDEHLPALARTWLKAEHRRG